MRFYQLSDEVEKAPNRWHIAEIVADGGTEPDFWSHSRYAGALLTAIIGREGRQLEFSLTSFGANPVAARNLAAAIETVAGADVQRIPLIVPGYAGFEVINTLRLVDCIDEQRSDEAIRWTEADDPFPQQKGQYRSIIGLRIRPSAVPPGMHVFRPMGWKVALIVSAQVKKAMEVVGCFGARFEDVT
jgi:hypothetical protein